MQGRGLDDNLWRARVWRPAVARAGLDPAPTPHDLRHSHAAHLIAVGWHPKAISARLGHGTPPSRPRWISTGTSSRTTKHPVWTGWTMSLRALVYEPCTRAVAPDVSRGLQASDLRLC